MSGTNLIHHATIMVTNLEKADEFYGGVLSLPKIPRPDFPSQGIWYEIDGIQIHLILSEEAEPPSPRHLAFVIDDLQATLRKVAQMELPIWDDIQLEGYVRRHCRDPFGNGVELLQRIEAPSGTGAQSSSYVNEKGQWHISEEKSN